MKKRNKKTYKKIIASLKHGDPPSQAITLYGTAFLGSGGVPNASMYAVLVNGLSKYETTVGEAKKFMVEMTGKSMRPDVETLVSLILGKTEEGREMVLGMKILGFMPRNKKIEKAMGKLKLKGPMMDIVKDMLLSK